MAYSVTNKDVQTERNLNHTMAEQHHKPCKTCPFTRNVEPGFLGGSPVETYVAQHFLPYRVPCHECVDYESKDWKAGANAANECVGFARCRNGAGVDEIMPDGVLHERYDPQGDGFKDIWDFWAFHKNSTRHEALISVRPDTIMAMCLLAQCAPDAKLLQAPRDISREEAILLQTIRCTWENALRDEFKVLTTSTEPANGV